MNKTQTNSPSATASDHRFKERFQYWQGRSGRRYICSIYVPAACPPLPGAVYIAVKKEADGTRVARAVGRFSKFWEVGTGNIAALARKTGANEIHVHLLAEDVSEAECTVDDLKQALSPAARIRDPEAHKPPEPHHRLHSARFPTQISLHPVSGRQIELFN